MSRGVSLINGSGAAFTAAILAGCLGWNLAAEAATPLAKVISDGLPKYDPHIRNNYLAAQAAAAAVAPQPVEEAAPAEPAAPELSVLLPRIVVRAPPATPKAEPAVRLPRLIVRPRGKEVAPDAFLTPAARDAALVKKHLTVFDRKVLNRFTLPLFGISKEARARQIEAAAHTAAELNKISDVLEMSEIEGADPEEQKKLRKMYLDAFIARPK